MAIVAIMVVGLLAYLYSNGTLTNVYSSILNSSIVQTSGYTSVPTTIPVNQTMSNASQLALQDYALSLINNDRNKYGLANVSLSNISSAQQHADNMIAYGYLSHWDIYGLKPYMRYTLLGGRGSVTENVAYVSNETCGLLGCTGNINVKNAIESMENSMMYNDSECCNNGHRDNILNPYHNQVSIGVAYNKTTVYLVEDFIDNYITWANGYPYYSNGTFSLQGSIQNGYTMPEILVSYDSPVQNMSVSELKETSDYSYGQYIAGIAATQAEYYSNISTVYANRYSVQGQNFNVIFNIDNLIRNYGAGEYTLLIWLQNGSGTNSTFIGSTYTVFINSAGNSYTEKNV